MRTISFRLLRRGEEEQKRATCADTSRTDLRLSYKDWLGAIDQKGRNSPEVAGDPGKIHAAIAGVDQVRYYLSYLPYLKDSLQSRRERKERIANVRL